MDVEPIKYIIISPVRNEEKFIKNTINSVISQSIKPNEWLIVNDGSTDGTTNILEEYAKKYNWIRTIYKHDRGFDKMGEGVVEAFYYGYNYIKTKDFEFIVKLDGDVSLSQAYFESIFKKFYEQPDLGIASGNIYYLRNDRLEMEKCQKFHTRGACKTYRHQCWEDIGELIPHHGWDGYDDLMAWMKGWKTRNFPELKIVHFRKMDTRLGQLKGKFKRGKIAYNLGFNPLFVIAIAFYRMLEAPILLGSLAIIWGFLSGYINRKKRFVNREFIQFVRKQQRNRLLRRSSMWR